MKMNLRHLLIACLLGTALLAVPLAARAATGPRCYVDSTPSGVGNDGNSWPTAYVDLQSALTDANCTEIWVAAGTYTPDGASPGDSSLSFVLQSGVEVYGGFVGTEGDLDSRDPATNVTILSGEIGAGGSTDNSYHVVTTSGVDSAARLDGFTITRGYADGGSNDNAGGGIYNNDGAPTLAQLIVYDNYAAGIGAGMYNQSTFPAATLSDITFDNNTAGTFGGGMHNAASSPTLSRVTFTGNHAGVDGGAMTNVTNAPQLTNVTFQGNTASGDGAAVFNSGGDITLTNVTFSGNIATGTGGAMYNELFSDPLVYNSIFWRTADDVFVDSGNSTTTIVDSIVYGGCPADATCTNVVDADPRLGPLQNNGGYTQTMALQGGSAALDAGGVNASCASEDQRRVSRPQGSGCDMGAYETYICYVDDSAAGAEDGTSWTDAYTSLQPALADAFCGQVWVAEGMYTPGSNEDDSFSPAPGVQLYGGFAGTEASVSARLPGKYPSILSGDIDNNDTNTNNVVLDAADIVGANSDHVVVMDGTAAVMDNGTIIDGFTITGGQADGAGFPSFVGGGMFCNGSSGGTCSPLLRNLTFSGNAALGGTSTNGGALYNLGSGGESSPTLEVVTFRGNRSDANGGAMFNLGTGGESSPSMTNVTFFGNTAADGGGAIFSAAGTGGVSSPVLIHATFGDNTADYGGALLINGNNGVSTPSIVNSILWGNVASADASDEMHLAGTTLTFNYNVMEGGDAGVVGGTPWASGIGNVSSSPELGPLADNGGYTETMALASGSSALDIAVTGSCPSTDQRLVTRPRGPGCDRGAYEKIPPASDFDYDHLTDPAKYVPSTNMAWWLKSSTGLWDNLNMGIDTTTFVSRSDFDGDGYTDPAKYVSGSQTLWWFRSSDSTWDGAYMGTGTYTLMPGSDFDGDQMTDPTKYMTDGSYWRLPSSTAVWVGDFIGTDAAPALPGSDYDGDGRTDVAKYVAAGAIWYLKSSDSTWDGMYIGSDGTPVPASDFDGDGITDMAKYLTGSNVLWWLGSNSGVWTGVYLGPGASIPVPAADFDGDGKTDPARFDTGGKALWWIRSSDGGLDGAYMGPETYDIVN